MIAAFSCGTQFHFNTATKPRTGSHMFTNAAATVSWSAPATLYETLGISENGTCVEIKRAYKQLARRFHPDASRDPERVDEFTRRFIQIQEAYETLSDPNTRALYDRDNLTFGVGPRNRPSYCYGIKEREKWRIQVDGLARKSMSKRKSTWGGRKRCDNNEGGHEA